jgi:hypothetical protein
VPHEITCCLYHTFYLPFIQQNLVINTIIRIALDNLLAISIGIRCEVFGAAVCAAIHHKDAAKGHRRQGIIIERCRVCTAIHIISALAVVHGELLVVVGRR